VLRAANSVPRQGTAEMMKKSFPFLIGRRSPKSNHMTLKRVPPHQQDVTVRALNTSAEFVALIARCRRDDGRPQKRRFQTMSSVPPEYLRLRLQEPILSFIGFSSPTRGFQLQPSAYPCSTRAFMSEYASATSLLNAAEFTSAPGVSFTWRIRLPLPSSRPSGSGNSAP
jgi:hypothetical protein